MHHHHASGRIHGTLVRYSVGIPAAGRPSCPHCHSALSRVPRRAFDRLLSLFVPVRRYRCRAVACSWEGTLRDRHLRPAPDAHDAYRRTPIDSL